MRGRTAAFSQSGERCPVEAGHEAMGIKKGEDNPPFRQQKLFRVPYQLARSADGLNQMVLNANIDVFFIFPSVEAIIVRHSPAPECAVGR